MGLLETKKELEEQLDEALKAEAQEEQPKEEVEQPKEPEKEEVKEEEPKKEEPTNPDYARLRREAAAAKKKAQEEEQRRIELEQRLARQEEVVDYVDEDKQQRPDPEIAEVLIRHKMEKAEKEFMALEQNFAKGVDDYEDISKLYAQEVARSIYVQNPRLTPEQVMEAAKKTILVKASNYMNQGYDPIEELYHEAKQLGLKPVKKEPEKAASLDKVEANKQRSSGFVAAKGSGDGRMTREHAVTMTNQEWAKLPRAEKERLMRGL
jgi:hypothetical protein